MLTLLRGAVGIVLLAGWALAALSLHLVRTSTGFDLVTKNKLTLDDTYIDVRAWKSDDETIHPVFYARLKQLDQTDLLKPADPTSIIDTAAANTPATDKPADAGSNNGWFAKVNSEVPGIGAGKRH